jgi:hypothetical protein
MTSAEREGHPKEFENLPPGLFGIEVGWDAAGDAGIKDERSNSDLLCVLANALNVLPDRTESDIGARKFHFIGKKAVGGKDRQRCRATRAGIEKLQCRDLDKGKLRPLSQRDLVDRADKPESHGENRSTCNWPMSAFDHFSGAIPSAVMR